MGSTILPKALNVASHSNSFKTRVPCSLISPLSSHFTPKHDFHPFMEPILRRKHSPSEEKIFRHNAEANPEEGAAEATEESVGEEDAEETTLESEASEAKVEERPP